MLTAAPFAIAKTWKQTQCPPTDEWIKKTRYTGTTEYYSVIKKNEITPSAAAWTGLEIITLSEARQKKNDTYHTYVWTIKYDINELI